jgi:VIT1/CCC1 family predicted Fe2+/Mn2+ transporter
MEVDPELGVFFAKIVVAAYVVGAALILLLAYWGSRPWAVWGIAIGFVAIAVAMVLAAMPIEKPATRSAIEQILMNVVIVGLPWIVIGAIAMIVGKRMAGRKRGRSI